MSTVNVSKTIHVPAAAAWAKLAAFTGIEEFSPIASSVVEGTGAGAKRTCTMPDGAQINEVMNSIDHETMHLQYAILSGPFPITDYVSDVRVKKVDADHCEVSWGCSFKAAPDMEKPMVATFDGFYHVIIEGLEQLIQKA
jgi:hypothetical protein